MGKWWTERRLKLIFGWILRVVIQLFFVLGSIQGKARKKGDIQYLQTHGVQLLQQDEQVLMYNGIVSITLTAPGGLVTSVTYNGSENLLETGNTDDNRGYWDVVWNIPGDHGHMDKLLGTSYSVTVQDENQTEISFTRTWAVGNEKVPLNVDRRFVMFRDSPGFYTYAVLEKLKGWPAFDIQEGRFLLKLQDEKFHYMAMSDVRKRVMPMPIDRATGLVLDYPEAVLLTNPVNPQLKGEVDDKYLYSCDNKDNKVHGWVSTDLGVGMWMITPSNEFKTGGPVKQDLTSHVGPTMLSMFISTHYAGEDLALKFEAGESWKKVFGPFLVYFNFDELSKENPWELWEDAKQKALEEVGSWPYGFPLSKDFVKPDQRGAVSGQLYVYDRYKNQHRVPGAAAYVGLATPGEAGSWQKESKGYQFWTQADLDGNFSIKNVVPGTYALFAWVPGTIGDYKYAYNITILPGSDIQLGNMVFVPPRRGPTLWEIGIPDRTAAEFFIPDPTQYKMHLYNNDTEKFRQYGLWYRYKDLYPNADLTFTIGESDYKKDWFFAHVTRKVGYRQYEAATWRILFDLKNVTNGANYTLQLALASANGAELQVRLNDAQQSSPDFTTNLIGQDNAVARHSIHGLYHLYSIDIAGSRLVEGKNTIFLTQAMNMGPFKEVMYDYIRLEGPAEAP